MSELAHAHISGAYPIGYGECEMKEISRAYHNLMKIDKRYNVDNKNEMDKYSINKISR